MKPISRNQFFMRLLGSGLLYALAVGTGIAVISHAVDNRDEVTPIVIAFLLSIVTVLLICYQALIMYLTWSPNVFAHLIAFTYALTALIATMALISGYILPATVPAALLLLTLFSLKGTHREKFNA